MRPAPVPDPDSAFFWEGLRARKLLLQACGACARHRFPPMPSCPYCGSRNTPLETPFGPTLCRAIYHCADCRQPFEQMKRV